MMPTHGRVYVEPFAGRGNVFFAAAPVLKFEKWVVNDIATAPFFRAIIEKGASVQVPMRTRCEYLRQKRLFQRGNPRAVLLEPYLTFSGGGYNKGGFGGKRSANAVGYTRTLRRCAEILSASRAKIMATDWKNLGLDSLTDSDFVFLDPPYYGADVRAYSNEFDFFGMIDVLSKARFRWMLTEYRQEFYINAFGQPCYTKPVQLACDGRGLRRRVECVWKNF
jgi:site-specific DNA-adenine methylase